jgi:hypothetical protein
MTDLRAPTPREGDLIRCIAMSHGVEEGDVGLVRSIWQVRVRGAVPPARWDVVTAEMLRTGEDWTFRWDCDRAEIVRPHV